MKRTAPLMLLSLMLLVSCKGRPEVEHASLPPRKIVKTESVAYDRWEGRHYLEHVYADGRVRLKRVHAGRADGGVFHCPMMETYYDGTSWRKMQRDLDITLEGTAAVGDEVVLMRDVEHVVLESGLETAITKRVYAVPKKRE